MPITCQRKPSLLGEGRGAGGLPGDDGFEQRLVIRLPNWRVLRLAARSVFLALAIVSFPWMGTTAVLRNANAGSPNPATNDAPLPPIDDVFFLPMLFRDLKRQSVFHPGAGRALFLGRNAHLRLPFLKQNKVDLVSDAGRGTVPDGSAAFVFASESVRDAATAGFIDRVLKVGGVAVLRLSNDPAGPPFRMPSNYKPVYIRRFASTIVGMRKTGDGGDAAGSGAHPAGRKLLSTVLEARKEALNGLEGVLLEPPRRQCSGRSTNSKYLKRTRYLPDLMGDTLVGYPRRLFVEVGPASGRRVSGGSGWFERNYPTRHRLFEIIRVETKGVTETAAKEEDMSSWLQKNVGEEDYVVMKAEAEVVEGMVRSRAIGLVDELFLECKNQWQKGVQGNRRAYWECLALYGRLRDEGIAVHQWWG